MKILLIRHGETDWNKNFRIQGITNIPLNETGINTSIKEGLKLRNYDISHAYSSTLDRAYQTCQYMMEGGNLNLTHTLDNRIIERSFGELEGTTFKDYREALKSNKLHTVETEESVYTRIRLFMDDIYLLHPEETVMVVTHGACIRVLLQKEKLIPSKEEIKNNPDYAVYERISNNSIHEIDYDGQNFRLIKYNV